MGSFINFSNFSKIVPYSELFVSGLAVTILLSLFTVLIGFAIGYFFTLRGGWEDDDL